MDAEYTAAVPGQVNVREPRRNLNSPKSGNFSRASFLLNLVGVLVIIQLCWTHLHVDRSLWRLGRQAAAPEAKAWPVPFDRLADGTNSGNFFLEIKTGFRAGELQGDLASYFYYRANYLLYPRRFYVAPETQIVNKGADLLGLNFQPDEDWLRQHDVISVWVYDFNGPSAWPFPRDGGAP